MVRQSQTYRVPVLIATGPVFRLGPNELTFNSAQAYQDIYGFRPGHQNMLKSPIHTGPVQVGATTTVQYAVEDSEHGLQRRALSHSFSTHALNEQEPIVQGYMTLFVSIFRRMAREEKEFNVGDWFCYFTFDTMGDLSFGESFGCLEHGECVVWMALCAGWLILFFFS